MHIEQLFLRDPCVQLLPGLDSVRNSVVFCREQLLQVLLRITEAVMKRPLENQRKDNFAESLASILFRVRLRVLSFTFSCMQGFIFIS